MSFRLVPISVTLNDLERRNDHCQVTTTEMTKYQTGRSVISIRINIFCNCVYVVIGNTVTCYQTIIILRFPTVPVFGCI